MILSIYSLKQFFQTYREKIPDIIRYEEQLEQIEPEQEFSLQQNKELAALYDQIYPLIEKELWASEHFDEMLENYQSLFREQKPE